eukprot:TRINITY_DN2326_c0_g1_i8.p1 TRINITY_DN2326_c0_g1~~TRINITY_DN2326_c0_g1_i8.p1  ORF type:complete len:270 (+),score=54.46 TRINITY_DN2326_c0_g1_i8:165-974(+)
MILKFVLWALSLCVLNAKTFKNPIVSAGADPWVIRHGGFYYYCRSGGGGIEVLKARKLQDIGHGERKVVFVPPVNKPYSKEIWAPELHHIHGKWYIYFAADDGNNANHRMYVLESSSPQGRYVLRGKIAARTDRWAIDGTVLHLKAGLFFVWSGWEGLRNYRQDLYIAKMSNPWTIVGERVLISRPTRQWERRAHPHVPGGINEGPQAFVSRGGVYIIYSASGSWSDDYCLGWIKCTNPAAVMDPKCWHKHGPVSVSYTHLTLPTNREV